MKTSIFITIAMLVGAILTSCEKESLFETPAIQTVRTLANQDVIRSCMEIMPEEDANAIESRSTAYEANLWEVGKNLRIRFISGTPYLHRKVEEFAREWEQYANVQFDFVSSGFAEIRIAFDTTDGSWSYIGLGALSRPQNEATMNFGWFDENTSDREFSRTVIHEFGHALGLVHEHQHPKNGIAWNREAVYDYYSHWSREKIDRNFFHRHSESQTQYCTYDKLSIMHYSIPRQFTLNGYTVDRNTELSDNDKWFINQMYPFHGVRKDINCDDICYIYEGVECYVYDRNVQNTVPLYRFYNTRNPDHFYTTSAEERDNVLSNYPDYVFEGVECFVYDHQLPGTKPVHRFVNTNSGDHFYTIDADAIDQIAEHIPSYNYEGIAFYAKEYQSGNSVPFHRFYHNGAGNHFYTASEEEKYNVLQDCRP